MNNIDKARHAPRGIMVYARLLHAVATNPGLTTSELAAIVKREDCAVRRHLLAMRALRLVRREEHIQRGITFRWHLGEDADKTTQRGDRVKPPPMLIAFASMLHACKDGATASEVAEACGYIPNNARRYVSMLRRQPSRLLRICRWERRDGHHGPAIPVYQYAPGVPDCAKPARKSRVEVNRQWRARVRTKRQQLAVLHAIAGNASIFRVAA